MATGVEEHASGLGGLAAQAPEDLYFGPALGVSANSVIPDVGAPGRWGPEAPLLPDTTLGGLPAGPVASAPVGNQQPGWGSVLDFHGSIAPWILVAALLLYGWLHVSFRVNAGKKVKAAAVI